MIFVVDLLEEYAYICTSAYVKCMNSHWQSISAESVYLWNGAYEFVASFISALRVSYRHFCLLLHTYSSALFANPIRVDCVSLFVSSPFSICALQMTYTYHRRSL